MIKNCSLLSAIILLVVCFAVKSFAQSNPDTITRQRPENIFIEAGSAGILISANYDTRFTKKRNGLGGRIGFAYWGDQGDRISLIPIQINYLFGQNSNFFEMGAGITFGSIGSGNIFLDSDNGNTYGTITTFTFGFRHQPIHRGLYYKFSFDPIFDTTNFQNFYPFFGIGIGYTIK